MDDVISIIGPSGTGKSTFLNLINRLEEPDGGTILFEGTLFSSGARLLIMTIDAGYPHTEPRVLQCVLAGSILVSGRNGNKESITKNVTGGKNENKENNCCDARGASGTDLHGM